MDDASPKPCGGQPKWFIYAFSRHESQWPSRRTFWMAAMDKVSSNEVTQMINKFIISVSTWHSLSELRRDKWQKNWREVDRFLSLWTNCYQFGHFQSTFSHFGQFLSIFCRLSRLDSDMFLSIRTLFPCSDWTLICLSTISLLFHIN